LAFFAGARFAVDSFIITFTQIDCKEQT